MFCKILKLIAPIAVAAFLAIPAAADIHIPVPDLEIHIAHSRPPHVRHERIPPRPGHDYVWIAGYWGWQGNDWVWFPGRWDRPEQTGVTWVRPRYTREYGSYRYEPGHWSHQRLVEGEEYRHWKEGHHHDRDRDRNRDER